MIPEAVTLATMALAMGTYGRIAAANEAAMIRDRIDAGINEDLDHGALLRERIAIGATITLVLSMAYAWFLNLDGRAAVLTILAHALRLSAFGWASFTVTHRLSLNSAREFPWWYCAPGNVYDRAWLMLAIWVERMLTGETDRYTLKDAAYILGRHSELWARATSQFPGSLHIRSDDRPTIVAYPLWYRRMVRAAGITMFAFESLVAGITLWSLWW